MREHAQKWVGRKKSDTSLSSMACAGELRPDEGDAFVAGPLSHQPAQRGAAAARLLSAGMAIPVCELTRS